MKNVTILFVLLLVTNIAFSQNLQFSVKGKYTRGISKEKLHSAQNMKDIRSGYPSGWVNEYVSTEIAVSTNGKIVKAYGQNETLSAEQQTLLQTADIGSEIHVEIGYVYLNPVTQFPDIREMKFVETVVPEIEAQYEGGYEELSGYILENAIHQIPEKLSKDLGRAIITFTVSETGQVHNVQLSETSKNPEIDLLLLRTISQMPAWKPAEDAKGNKIPQEFEFRAGNDGC